MHLLNHFFNVERNLLRQQAVSWAMTVTLAKAIAKGRETAHSRAGHEEDDERWVASADRSAD
ncbi:MAG: hypothetical protein ACLP0J_17015 [Solirubrobacteraceae bacterium]